MAGNLNVLVICGSLRKDSYNAAVARALPSLVPANMKLKDAPPFGGFPLYNADLKEKSGEPADVIAWADAIRAADGVDHRLSGIQLDHSRRAQERDRLGVADEGHPVQGQAGRAAIGLDRSARRLPHAISFAPDAGSIDAIMFGRPEIFVTMAQTKIENGELKDQPTKDIIKKQLEGFAAFIERVRA